MVGGVLLLGTGIVGGVFLGKQLYSLPSKTLVTEGQPSPTPTDPTANWKTYSDKNFSFKYPDDGTLNHNQTGNVLILTYSPTKYEIKFTFHKSSNEDLKKYLSDRYLPNAHGNYTTSPAEPIQVAGYNGYMATVYAVDSGWFGYIVLESQDKKSVIDIEYWSAVLENRENKTVFDQILSTFRFLNQATSVPTCKPRPACLDAAPRCLIPETSDMCPPNQKL